MRAEGPNSSSWDVEITLRSQTEWTKMMNARQRCQHLAKVCGIHATKAPEDDETEFVGDSLSDR